MCQMVVTTVEHLCSGCLWRNCPICTRVSSPTVNRRLLYSSALLRTVQSSSSCVYPAIATTVGSLKLKLLTLLPTLMLVLSQDICILGTGLSQGAVGVWGVLGLQALLLLLLLLLVKRIELKILELACTILTTWAILILNIICGDPGCICTSLILIIVRFKRDTSTDNFFALTVFIRSELLVYFEHWGADLVCITITDLR